MEHTALCDPIPRSLDSYFVYPTECPFDPAQPTKVKFSAPPPPPLPPYTYAVVIVRSISPTA